MHRRGEVILLVVLCLKGSEASERKTREEGTRPPGAATSNEPTGARVSFYFICYLLYM